MNNFTPPLIFVIRNHRDDSVRRSAEAWRIERRRLGTVCQHLWRFDRAGMKREGQTLHSKASSLLGLSRSPSFTPSSLNGGKAGSSEFHNVYVQSGAFHHDRVTDT